MKKILCVILILLFSILLFLNVKPNFVNIDNRISDCVEISDSLFSIYDNVYTEQDIKNMSDKFNNSDIVFLAMIEVYNQIANIEYIPLDFLLDVGFTTSITDAMDGEVNLRDKDIVVYEIDNKKMVKLSDVSGSNSFVYEGTEYFLDWDKVLTYENIINSLDYSYIFDTAYVEDNYIYCKYNSKGYGSPLTVVFEFNIFDKLSKISVVE